MQLALPEVFAEQFFEPSSRPDVRTVRAWLKSGELPGRKLGKSIYVDLDVFTKSTGNKVADKLLEALKKDALPS